MSKLYGSIPVSARSTTPTARAHDVLVTRADGLQGAIEVTLIVQDDGRTTYTVRQVPNKLGNVGPYAVLAQGYLGEDSETLNSAENVAARGFML